MVKLPIVQKKKTVILVFVIFFTIMIGPACSTSSGEQKSDSLNIIAENPFFLENNRVVPGEELKFKYYQQLLEKGIIERMQIDVLRAYPDPEKPCTQADVLYTIPKTQQAFTTDKNGKSFLTLRMPPMDTTGIGSLKGRQTWGGILWPYDAVVRISFGVKEPPECKSGEVQCFDFPIEIASRNWGIFWGLLVVVASFFIMYRLSRNSGPAPKPSDDAPDGKETDKNETAEQKRNIYLFPLEFAVTPIGRYSVSITQILIFTYITIFGLVYVFFTTGTLLNISDQVLKLLGIGAGTALLAKMNASTKAADIKPKYLQLTANHRTPKLRDLISIGKNLNIFKFQVLIFTLFTAYVVVAEILRTYVFPTIPGELITLMGLSSAAYLGNEVTGKNVWEEVKEKIKTIEDHAKDTRMPIESSGDIANLNIEAVDELKALLREIYS